MKVASLPPLPTNQESLPTLISQLRGLIESARGQALRAVDSIQVRTCWEIGRHIVEFEQQGADRAMYGSRLIPKLAESLTAEFGKGFDERNLRHMRTFFQDFPIWNAVRTELSCTHYRNLLRVDGRGFFFESFQFRPGTAHDLKPAAVIAMAALHPLLAMTTSAAIQVVKLLTPNKPETSPCV